RSTRSAGRRCARTPRAWHATGWRRRRSISTTSARWTPTACARSPPTTTAGGARADRRAAPGRTPRRAYHLRAMPESQSSALAEGTILGGEVRVGARLGDPSAARAVYAAQRVSGGGRSVLVVAESGLFADAASREQFVARTRFAASVDSAHVAPPFATGYDE